MKGYALVTNKALQILDSFREAHLQKVSACLSPLESNH